MTTTPIPTGPNGPASAGPSKLVIALIAVGALLVVALVVIAFQIGQSSGGGAGNNNAGAPAPSSSQDPATPVGEATDEPTVNSGDSGDSDDSDGQQAPDNSLRFTSFNADQQVACDTTGQAEEKAQPQISWASANAVKVYWTPNNEDATADNGYQVGASGNQNDMSTSKGPGERYEFPCNHRQTFDTTITIYGANGQKVSKHVTFTDINWDTGGDDD